MDVPSDALSSLAPLFRVRPELQYVCRFGHAWASPHPPEPDNWAPFHVVTGGTCVLHLTASERSIPLTVGDVAVLPRGSAHAMHGATTPATAAGPFGIAARSNGAILVKSNTDGPPDAQLVCGRLNSMVPDRTWCCRRFPRPSWSRRLIAWRRSICSD